MPKMKPPPDQRPGWNDKSVAKKMFAWGRYNEARKNRRLDTAPYPIASLTPEQRILYKKNLDQILKDPFHKITTLQVLPLLLYFQISTSQVLQD